MYAQEHFEFLCVLFLSDCEEETQPTDSRYWWKVWMPVKGVHPPVNRKETIKKLLKKPAYMMIWYWAWRNESATGGVSRALCAELPTRQWSTLEESRKRYHGSPYEYLQNACKRTNHPQTTRSESIYSLWEFRGSVSGILLSILPPGYLIASSRARSNLQNRSVAWC